MKKISALILAVALACSSGYAQTPKNSADTVTVSGVVNIEMTDSVAAADPISDADYLDDSEPVEAPSVSVKDGKWSLTYDKSDYIISDLVADARFAERFRDLEDFDAESLILKDNMGMATAIIAIIFGVPCLTIIVGLIVILAFALKRNRGRNELINNAIDRGYQLPDAFYVGQKNNTATGAPTRDSRKFYSATTLIATGLSLVIFALYADASFFVLAGGIPLLIGIGQLIGYFCVPTSPSQPKNPPYGGGQPFYGHYQNPRPWQPAPGQYQAPGPQPYTPSPEAAPQCPPMGDSQAPASQPMPTQEASAYQPAPQDASQVQPAAPQPTQAPSQTPPPYNPS